MGDWKALPRGSFFRSARLDLALPYSESAPFPLPELFCLAHIGTVDGRKCVIYRVNEKNSPIL